MERALLFKIQHILIIHTTQHTLFSCEITTPKSATASGNGVARAAAEQVCSNMASPPRVTATAFSIVYTGEQLDPPGMDAGGLAIGHPIFDLQVRVSELVFVHACACKFASVYVCMNVSCADA